MAEQAECSSAGLSVCGGVEQVWLLGPGCHHWNVASMMKVKEENEKAGLKHNILKTKITASGPITSWHIDGETVADLILGSPKSLQKVTAALKLKDAYSLEGKL